MKKYISVLLFSWLAINTLFARVYLEGTLGPYPIEMVLELSSGDLLHEPIQGKYRKVGQEEYIALMGNFYGGKVFWLEEIGVERTGEFFIEIGSVAKGRAGTKVRGEWGSQPDRYQVNLHLESGSWDELQLINQKEIQKNLSNAVGGTYAAMDYSLNKKCAHCKNGLGITHSGGMLVVEEYGTDSITISFDFNFHSPYQWAGMHQKGAIRVGKRKYRVTERIWEDNSAQHTCKILFHFGEKEVRIIQRSRSSECNFTGGGSADFSCFKFHDQALPIEEDFNFQLYWLAKDE